MGAVPLMPSEPPLDEALNPAILQAERGLFLTALRSVAKLSAEAGLKEDVATFRKRIASHLERSVKSYAEAVADEDNRDRYLAFLALTKMGEDFGSSAPGKAAKQAASAHASASWVSDEEEAADDYRSIMRRAARADDDRSRARINRAHALTRLDNSSLSICRELRPFRVFSVAPVAPAERPCASGDPVPPGCSARSASTMRAR